MDAARLVAELERRDEDAAAALAAVENLQAHADRIRSRTAAVRSFLAGLPAERERRAEAVRGAEARLAVAEAALAEADRALEAAREKERPAAERAAGEASQGVHVAIAELGRARDAGTALEAEADQAEAEAESLERDAAAAAGRLAQLPRLAREAGAPPGAGLPGIEDWAARARAALLVVHGALAAERDAIVREANELGSAVLGEPLGATSVARVRERIASALQSRAP